MSQLKKLTIINGSPKVDGDSSVSDYLSVLAETKIQNGEFHIERFRARKSVLAGSTDAFSAMAESEAILLVFPLYFFCLPGILTRFLQDYASFVKAQPQNGKVTRVYAIVNCGFPEDEINSDALRVVESFSRAIGAQYRFGLRIGGGGMILGAKDAPFMKEFMKTIDGFLSDVQNDIIAPSNAEHESMHASVKFPRKLYFMMGNFGWKMQAKQNGLKPRDLKKKPYRA